MRTISIPDRFVSHKPKIEHPHTHSQQMDFNSYKKRKKIKNKAVSFSILFIYKLKFDLKNDYFQKYYKHKSKLNEN